MSELEGKPDYSARQQVVRKIYRILSRINCIPPFEDTINFRHLQRLHELMRELKSLDPEYPVTDVVQTSELNILKNLDRIQTTRSWDDAGNKLVYINIQGEISKIRKFHPDWDVDLDCIYRYHICRCLRCKSEGFLCTQHVLDSSNEISSPQSDTSEEGKPFPALNSKNHNGN